MEAIFPAPIDLTRCCSLVLRLRLSKVFTEMRMRIVETLDNEEVAAPEIDIVAPFVHFTTAALVKSTPLGPLF